MLKIFHEILLVITGTTIFVLIIHIIEMIRHENENKKEMKLKNKKKMKKIFCLVAVSMLLMTSCLERKGDDYHYRWDVQVTYLDNTTEKIHCEMNTFKGYDCELELTENGSLKGVSLIETKIFANGVRKFEILSTEKEPIFK